MARTRSAALAIALALLLVLTLLAAVGVRTLRRDAGPADGEAAARLAFEAAERALHAGLERAAQTRGAAAIGELAPGPDGARGSFRINAAAADALGEVSEGFSLGSDSAFRAFPIEVEAVGTFKGRRVRLGMRANLAVIEDE